VVCGAHLRLLAPCSMVSLNKLIAIKLSIVVGEELSVFCKNDYFIAKHRMHLFVA